MFNILESKRRSMKMYQLIEWFQLNYSKLHKDLVRCNHSYDKNDLNPYHLETACWSHTMLVCKVAEMYNYDKVVLIAALLHDIGKPKSRKINPRNNHVQFFGHENLSVKLADEVLSQMRNEKMITIAELNEINELIAKHSFLHREVTPHELFEEFRQKKQLYTHLVQLNRCDALGRFCADTGFDDDRYERLISYSKNMDN